MTERERLERMASGQSLLEDALGAPLGGSVITSAMASVCRNAQPSEEFGPSLLSQMIRHMQSIGPDVDVRPGSMARALLEAAAVSGADAQMRIHDEVQMSMVSTPLGSSNFFERMQAAMRAPVLRVPLASERQDGTEWAVDGHFSTRPPDGFQVSEAPGRALFNPRALPAIMRDETIFTPAPRDPAMLAAIWNIKSGPRPVFLSVTHTDPVVRGRTAWDWIAEDDDV
jgi:hypothetical protein